MSGISPKMKMKMPVNCRRQASLDDSKVYTKDGKKKESRSGKRERNRRLSMSSAMDSGLECPGFLMGHLIERRDPVTSKASVSSASRESAGKSGSSKSCSKSPVIMRRSSMTNKARRSSMTSKARDQSPDKARSKSPAGKRRSSMTSKARGVSPSNNKARSKSPGGKRRSSMTSKSRGDSPSSKRRTGPPSKSRIVSPGKERRTSSPSMSRSRSPGSKKHSSSGSKRLSRTTKSSRESHAERKGSSKVERVVKRSESQESVLEFMSTHHSNPRQSVLRSKSQESINDLVSQIDKKPRQSRRTRHESEKSPGGKICIRKRSESVSTSRTKDIRSSLGAAPLRKRHSDLEAPDTHSVMEVPKAEGRRPSRRPSIGTPAVAAAATVLHTSGATRTRGQQRRSNSVKPGGRVRRNSVRSGSGFGDPWQVKPEAMKKDITGAFTPSPRRSSLPQLEMKGFEDVNVVPFADGFDEASLFAYSPRRSPKKTKSLEVEGVMTSPTLKAKMFSAVSSAKPPRTPSKKKTVEAPGTPSGRTSRSGSSKSTTSRKSRRNSTSSKSPDDASQQMSEFEGFTRASPRRGSMTSVHKSPRSPHKSPRRQSLMHGLHQLKASRQDSVTGGVADDAKSVESTLSRLQRRVSLPASSTMRPQANNVIVW